MMQNTDVTMFNSLQETKIRINQCNNHIILDLQPTVLVLSSHYTQMTHPSACRHERGNKVGRTCDMILASGGK